LKSDSDSRKNNHNEIKWLLQENPKKKRLNKFLEKTFKNKFLNKDNTIQKNSVCCPFCFLINLTNQRGKKE